MSAHSVAADIEVKALKLKLVVPDALNFLVHTGWSEHPIDSLMCVYFGMSPCKASYTKLQVALIDIAPDTRGSTAGPNASGTTKKLRDLMREMGLPTLERNGKEHL